MKRNIRSRILPSVGIKCSSNHFQCSSISSRVSASAITEITINSFIKIYLDCSIYNDKLLNQVVDAIFDNDWSKKILYYQQSQKFICRFILLCYPIQNQVWQQKDQQSHHVLHHDLDDVVMQSMDLLDRSTCMKQTLKYSQQRNQSIIIPESCDLK